MNEGLTLQFDLRKGTKNNKMKRFHPLKTKNESLPEDSLYNHE